MTDHWQPGTSIVHRGIAPGPAGGRVWIAHAVTVVEDRPDRVALYLAPGAPCKIPSELIGRKYSSSGSTRSRWDEQDGGDWTLDEWTWQRTHALILLEPERYYALFCFWSAANGTFTGWYVNFQLPFRRTAASIDTLDLELDLEIFPDGTRRWKDVAEYDEGVRRGSIDARTAAAVEQARIEVLSRIDDDPAFLDPCLIGWRPSPEWQLPSLPPDWEVVNG